MNWLLRKTVAYMVLLCFVPVHLFGTTTVFSFEHSHHADNEHGVCHEAETFSSHTGHDHHGHHHEGNHGHSHHPIQPPPPQEEQPEDDSETPSDSEPEPHLHHFSLSIDYAQPSANSHAFKSLFFGQEARTWNRQSRPEDPLYEVNKPPQLLLPA